MDIYTWLSYRLPKVQSRAEVFVRFDDLKPIFGTGDQGQLQVRQALHTALTEALRWYQVGRVGIDKEGVRLLHSPSLVPIDLARSPYGRTIASGRRRLTLVEPPTL